MCLVPALRTTSCVTAGQNGDTTPNNTPGRLAKWEPAAAVNRPGDEGTRGHPTIKSVAETSDSEVEGLYPSSSTAAPGAFVLTLWRPCLVFCLEA